MITEHEQSILTHILHWGSDGYGAFVSTIKRQWWVQGCPKPFATKRAAIAYFEAYLEALRDRKAGRSL